jgi:hypothetical protein
MTRTWCLGVVGVELFKRGLHQFGRLLFQPSALREAWATSVAFNLSRRTDSLAHQNSNNMSSAGDIQVLLRFLSQDAKISLATAMGKIKDLQKAGLGT